MTILDTALRLIKQYGVPVEIKRTVGGGVDPITGVVSTATETTYSTHGTPVSEKWAFLSAFNNTGTTEQVYLLTSEAEPDLGDRVTIGNRMMTVKEYYPKYYTRGQVAYYTVRLV